MGFFSLEILNDIFKDKIFIQFGDLKDYKIEGEIAPHYSTLSTASE
jgi:hypothetical protein